GPSFARWLFRIARNSAIDTLRSRRPSQAVDPHSVEELVEERVSREDPHADQGGDFDLGALVHTLLPADQRLLLRLRYDVSRAADAARRLVLVSGRPQVQRMLEATRLVELFEWVDDPIRVDGMTRNADESGS